MMYQRSLLGVTYFQFHFPVFVCFYIMAERVLTSDC